MQHYRQSPPSSDAAAAHWQQALARRSGAALLLLASLLLAASALLPYAPPDILGINAASARLAELDMLLVYWLGGGRFALPLLVFLYAARLWRGRLAGWRVIVSALALLAAPLGGEAGRQMLAVAQSFAPSFLADSSSLTMLTALAAVLAAMIALPELPARLWLMTRLAARFTARAASWLWRRRPGSGWGAGWGAENAAAQLAARFAPPRRARRAARRSGLPPLGLLQAGESFRATLAAQPDRREELTEVLADFGIAGTITGRHAGPVVTLYEFAPAAGIKSSRVIGLAGDIARSMSVLSARVAVIPGRNALGVELANDTRAMVSFADVLKDSLAGGDLALALGVGIDGKPVSADLAAMPHLLIAGTTGAGKSVAVNTMILSLLCRLRPDQCRLILIDPKMLELSVYQDIPHLLAPVVVEAKKAIAALKWAAREMERRYHLMAQAGVRSIASYNAKHSPLPFLVIVIDEMADLMIAAGKEIEVLVQRLAQMARAAGLHLIAATQRPSVDVITGTIKANFPTRISFQVTSRIDSRTILGQDGAEHLLGRGDMLLMQSGGRIQRVHGGFVSEEEVQAIADFWRAQGQPDYSDDVLAVAGEAEAEGSETGDLYAQARQLVLTHKRPTTSFLQRKLKIGYNRAANLIEQMEEDGLVSPPAHNGKREVLL